MHKTDWSWEDGVECRDAGQQDGWRRNSTGPQVEVWEVFNRHEETSLTRIQSCQMCVCVWTHSSVLTSVTSCPLVTVSQSNRAGWRLLQPSCCLSQRSPETDGGNERDEVVDGETRLVDSLVWIALTRSMFYWPSGTPWLQTALFWESLCHIFDKDTQA